MQGQCTRIQASNQQQELIVVQDGVLFVGRNQGQVLFLPMLHDREQATVLTVDQAKQLIQALQSAIGAL